MPKAEIKTHWNCYGNINEWERTWEIAIWNVVHGCSFIGCGFCLDLRKLRRCIGLWFCLFCVYILGKFEAPNNRINSNRTDSHPNEIAFSWIANRCAPISKTRHNYVRLDKCIFMIVRWWYRTYARCDPNHLLNFDELLCANAAMCLRMHCKGNWPFASGKLHLWHQP